MKGFQLQECNVRIGGQLVRPGDHVIVRTARYPGYEGRFCGKLLDGRFVVKLKFGTYGQTLLRCTKGEIERSKQPC